MFYWFDIGKEIVFACEGHRKEVERVLETHYEVKEKGWYRKEDLEHTEFKGATCLWCGEKEEAQRRLDLREKWIKLRRNPLLEIIALIAFFIVIFVFPILYLSIYLITGNTSSIVITFLIIMPCLMVGYTLLLEFIKDKVNEEANERFPLLVSS